MRSQPAAAALAGGLLQAALVHSKHVLQPTPPMGFNNWARFQCNLNQSLFTDTADAMASNGLRDAGYNRLNLDDCWMLHERAANGSLQWDSEKFPKGIPWLGEYLHKKGFHFGVYEDAGTETCGGYPGTLGYEALDAKTFADWGFDYLKLDGCNVPTMNGSTSEESYKAIYGKWHDILSAMPQPLVFSESAPAYFSGDANLSDWYTVMDWVPSYGQLARHSDDILVFSRAGNGFNTWESMMTNYGFEVRLARYQKPGYYNDPDFIVADWPDLSITEKRTHFALWCSFSAPLIISAYVPDLTDDELEYLTNADLIAVDQDALALQATLVSQDGTWDVLTKSLSNGDRLLTVFNRGNDTASQSISMERLGLDSKRKSGYEVKDLWTGDKSHASDKIKIAKVPSHGTAVFRISSKGNGKSDVTPTGMIFNTASLACVQSSPDSTVSNSTCSGVDSQVWTVADDGSIRTLASSSKCLTAGKDGAVTMASCKKGDKAQRWTYHLSGNLANGATGGCLTETAKGDIVTAACTHEANGQVFGLPSGVEIH